MLRQDFFQRWHRDDVKEDATEAEEHDALQIWHHGVCFLPLFHRPPTHTLYVDSVGPMEYVRYCPSNKLTILTSIAHSERCSLMLVYSLCLNHTNSREPSNKDPTQAHPNLRMILLTCQVPRKLPYSVIIVDHWTGLLRLTSIQFFIQLARPSSITPTSYTVLHMTQIFLERRSMHAWETLAADLVVLVTFFSMV